MGRLLSSSSPKHLYKDTVAISTFKKSVLCLSRLYNFANPSTQLLILTSPSMCNFEHSSCIIGACSKCEKAGFLLLLCCDGGGGGADGASDGNFDKEEEEEEEGTQSTHFAHSVHTYSPVWSSHNQLQGLQSLTKRDILNFRYVWLFVRRLNTFQNMT